MVEKLTDKFDELNVKDKIDKAIKIQKLFRGCILRLKRLPLICIKYNNI